MTAKKEKINIKHPGWKVAWTIYSKENLRKSLVLPLVLSITTITICLFSGQDPIYLLSYLADMIIRVVPVVLGFILSGYALIMGLNDSKYINGLKSFRPNGHSLFQSLNSTFAIVLYVLFFTLIIGVVVGAVIEAKIFISLPNENFVVIYNWAWVFLISFFLYYAINSIKDIVINIFNFGQYSQSKYDNDIANNDSKVVNERKKRRFSQHVDSK